MSIRQDIENRWMEAVRDQRNRTAFHALIGRYKQGAYGLAYRYLNHESDAEEIVQDAFVKLWWNAGQWNIDKGHVRSWLFKIVINNCRDFWRREKKRYRDISMDQKEAFELEDHTSNPHKDRAKSQVQTRLKQAILTLKPTEREILLLSYYHHLSHREIGAIVGLSDKAVERRLYKTRNVLKERLSDLKEMIDVI